MMIAHKRAYVLFMFAEIVRGECNSKRKNKVFTDLILPNRILSYAKIVRGECTDKTEKTQFFLYGFAEPNPILCRYNPILCKDKDKILFQYNKKVKNSTLPLIRSRLPLCIPICDKKFAISVVFCITFASNLQ